MVRLQLTVVAMALVLCGSNAEARGRRSAQNQYYTPYYNVAPSTNVGVPTGTVVSTTAVTPTTSTVPNGGIIQTSATLPANAIVTANSVVPATATTSGTVVGSTTVVAAAAPGSAQWKAEQSARLCSVQHLGGGFGGGSFEGNGFGATAQQAITGSCFWGQRTPIEIGVARGANGYYATVFYR